MLVCEPVLANCSVKPDVDDDGPITTTLKPQLALLLQPSVTWHETGVVPTGNVLPLGGL